MVVFDEFRLISSLFYDTVFQKLGLIHVLFHHHAHQICFVLIQHSISFIFNQFLELILINRRALGRNLLDPQGIHVCNYSLQS